MELALEVNLALQLFGWGPHRPPFHHQCMDTNMETNTWAVVVLGIGLATAVLTDITTHRIPNWLTLSLATACLLLQLWFNQWHGLLYSTTGLVVGFLCFLPSHVYGAMGAGDVKMMAAVGTALGPWTVLIAVVLTIITGGLFALIHIGLKGGIGSMLRRYSHMFLLLLRLRPQYVPPAVNEASALRFPYALAIASGTATALWLVSFKSGTTL